MTDDKRPNGGPDPIADPPSEVAHHRVEPARRAREAIEALRGGVLSAAESTVDRVSQAIDDVERSWSERPGARVRRVRRMGAAPLASLYDAHPEARLARPVQVGTRTIDVDAVCGTAVGGGDQRGGDFLPLKPFRGRNWTGRWQRLRKAQDRLAILPPIDVVKYDGCYWVVDGHNRVALALYVGQAGIDATIVELVPTGGSRTEPIMSLADSAADSRSVRTAGTGHRPSDALSFNDPIVPPTVDNDE